MIVEYAGPADRSAGPGWIHKARAWWNVNSDDQGEVKRAVLRAVRAEVPDGSVVTFMDWHMDTSTSPTINAWPSVRVLSADEHEAQERLKTLRYTTCDGGCGNAPGQVVAMLPEGEVITMPGEERAPLEERALCYACWKPLADAGKCKVLHWVQADGRLQV